MSQQSQFSPIRERAINKAKSIEDALRTAQGAVKGHADDAQELRELLEGKDPEQTGEAEEKAQ